MNKKIQILLSMLILILASCTPKVDDKKWDYELEAYSTGKMGTYQVKVFTYHSDPDQAIELSKMNAVHGIIFKGFPDKERIKGQKPLANKPNTLENNLKFFNDFFEINNDYLRYVTLSNDGKVLPGDRVKVGNKYKVGVIVSVNVGELRKYLEKKGIIKSLTDGF